MKFLPLTGVLLGVLMSALIIVGIIHNRTNHRHNVEFISGSDFDGYMNTPAMAQVNISPAIAWDSVKTSTKTVGTFFLVLMWVGMWLVGSNFHVKFTRGKSASSGFWLGFAMIVVPLILSCVFFFSAFSSRYANNSVAVKKEAFDLWIQNGEVEQRGEKTYVDVNGSTRLSGLFTKPLIQ